MEETISFKRVKANSNKAHYVQIIDLFHVPIHHLEDGGCEIEKDSKGFSLRRGDIASQVAFGHLFAWKNKKEVL